MQRQKNINNSKKTKQMVKEEENFREIPEIDPISDQIVIDKGDYIPIYKRAIELQNQKKMKIILNERKKNKEIEDMIKKYNNSLFYVDENEINEFYNTQLSWKEKIKKRNKTLYIKKQEEKMKEEKKLLSYKLEINENSKKITENNLKYYNTLNNASLSNNRYKSRNKENVFDRLYNDSKLQEKKRIN